MRLGPTLAALAALLAAPGAWAGPPPPAAAPAKKYRYPTQRKVDNRPLAPGLKAASAMAPFSQGDCGICHRSSDPKSPGPTKRAGNALCTTCHEEFQEIMARAYPHPPAVASCTNCHNPHNSAERKLLHEELSAQCFDCHRDIQGVVQKARVKHGALSERRKCANCHNPHAANIERMLNALPFDQCVGCHSVDDRKDANGVVLTNYRTLLEENKVWHKPVASKDCSACHKTHGGDNFRLLVAGYPSQFYAPYDLKNYSLCYGCHNDKVVSVEFTTKYTNFRDGAKNLHFAHVAKLEQRGRTCRACHDVHAAKQKFRIRDGVPFGREGWMLRINFTRTATGGTCTKTCHEAKSYVNKPALADGQAR